MDMGSVYARRDRVRSPVRSSLRGVLEKLPHLHDELRGLRGELFHVSRLEDDELLIVATVAILEVAVANAAP
jgi:hypothetical protein